VSKEIHDKLAIAAKLIHYHPQILLENTKFPYFRVSALIKQLIINLTFVLEIQIA
jgi:hypothetical protein